MKKIIELTPVKEKPEYFEQIERAIIEHLRKELYAPLMKELELPQNKMTNSIDDLLNALLRGTITFSKGRFEGKFNARTTNEIRKLGGVWDRKTASFKLPYSQLPPSVKQTVSLSENKFIAKMKRIDKILAQLLPENIAESLKISKLFDASIYKMSKDIDATLKAITVQPSLTDESRKIIADDYTNNMKLYIKSFTEDQIKGLRVSIAENVFAGDRYEALIGTIQKSYDVTLNKAKFLARQETNLLLSKYKETRYIDAGVSKYIWRTVGGTAKHPVRPMHKKLDGQVFSFDNPPVTNDKGDRNNPGQDFGCRCYARPFVEKNETK